MTRHDELIEKLYEVRFRRPGDGLVLSGIVSAVDAKEAKRKGLGLPDAKICVVFSAKKVPSTACAQHKACTRMHRQGATRQPREVQP